MINIQYQPSQKKHYLLGFVIWAFWVLFLVQTHSFSRFVTNSTKILSPSDSAKEHKHDRFSFRDDAF